MSEELYTLIESGVWHGLWLWHRPCDTGHVTQVMWHRSCDTYDWTNTLIDFFYKLYLLGLGKTLIAVFPKDMEVDEHGSGFL